MIKVILIILGLANVVFSQKVEINNIDAASQHPNSIKINEVKKVKVQDINILNPVVHQFAEDRFNYIKFIKNIDEALDFHSVLKTHAGLSCVNKEDESLQMNCYQCSIQYSNINLIYYFSKTDFSHSECVANKIDLSFVDKSGKSTENRNNIIESLNEFKFNKENNSFSTSKIHGVLAQNSKIQSSMIDQTKFNLLSLKFVSYKENQEQIKNYYFYPLKQMEQYWAKYLTNLNTLFFPDELEGSNLSLKSILENTSAEINTTNLVTKLNYYYSNEDYKDHRVCYANFIELLIFKNEDKNIILNKDFKWQKNENFYNIKWQLNSSNFSKNTDDFCTDWMNFSDLLKSQKLKCKNLDEKFDYFYKIRAQLTKKDKMYKEKFYLYSYVLMRLKEMEFKLGFDSLAELAEEKDAGAKKLQKANEELDYISRKLDEIYEEIIQSEPKLNEAILKRKIWATQGVDLGKEQLVCE